MIMNYFNCLHRYIATNKLQSRFIDMHNFDFKINACPKAINESIVLRIAWDFFLLYFRFAFWIHQRSLQKNGGGYWLKES